MKRLLILALVAVAAWQAWQHYPDVFTRKPANEVVVENSSGESVRRVRVGVGGQTFAREELPAGESVSFRFRLNRDASFHLAWETGGGASEREWRGGEISAGPLVARHRLTICDDGGVVHQTEPLSAPAP